MQILMNGLLQGILFGATGVAFSLVYRTTRIFHIALGGIYILAPYLVLCTSSIGLPHWLGSLLAVIIASFAGILVEESIHWPLTRHRAPSEVHLIASLGTYLIFVQGVALIWGNETRVLRTGVDVTWAWGEITLALAQTIGPMVALCITAGLFAWLLKANLGIELRALADNPMLVALLGRNIRVLRRMVFGLSGAVMATASIAQAWDVGFDPHIGLKAVLIGMVAMIIGGTGNFAGPFVGGILLGILRTQVVWFGSARWEEAVTFVLLALFLFFRPQGIFSRQARLEEGA